MREPKKARGVDIISPPQVYRPLGVVVVLSHLEVWESGDKIPVTANYEQNLAHFKKYRLEMMEKKPHYNNDNTMLLTTVNFKGRTVGYAIVSGMCKTENSAGVVQDKRDHVGVVAYTVSHEMGHNFGMKHDGPECRCATPFCIMSGTGSDSFKPHVSWSSCSQQVIEKNVDSESYQCLINVPTRMYPRSSCGDGVVDYGEECDCGPKEFCDNPCCVAATCRFAVNATCASGPCCDTKKCQFKPAGVGCREAFTECDLPEFCSGNSESCPEDFTKADGTPCDRSQVSDGRLAHVVVCRCVIPVLSVLVTFIVTWLAQGHCYEGRCGSHGGMCRAVWGQHAVEAEDACYSNLNKRGGTNGNCGFKGHTKDELLPCQDGDVLCGSLHCLAGQNAVPVLRVAMNYGTFTLARHQCQYVVASRKLLERYWLTPDGAKCGQGKMCLKQKCVNISEPSGDCRGGCSGHGVCNSLNHCHCDPGYAPPDCSRKGEGGSIDSARTGRGRYIDPLWEALFVLALLALGVAILLCCLWSHVRRWWEARGRASTLPCCARCLDACCCPLMSLITDRLCTRKRNEKVTKDAKQAWEQDKMICRVDLDLKDKDSHTYSWGVANEKLVTEVVTMKPSFSPDFRRKIQLTSRHCAPHTLAPQTVDHPAYIHSISVDSGCVSDVEEAVVEPYNSRVSMKSLVSLFKKFGTRQEKEASPPKTYERQRSVPLRRLIVDPLAGSHSSRQGTPSPDNARLGWSRSVSQNEKSACTGRPGGLPPPPPLATEKPYTKKDKSPHGCKSTRQEDVRPQSPPLRPAPTPASAPHHAPSWQQRRPMMPPGKKQTSTTIKTQSKTEITTKINVSQQDKAPQTSPPRRPLLPPGKGSEPARAAKLPKAPDACSKPRAAEKAPPPHTTGGKVKDLAKKIEKQRQ
ncbi:Disintegrin and metalloproteinase domain-containing protein 28 [Portunus trituberculatus]|uniref:Disintegrin and metalloproteinase domain-containing protein 28 n=1 Tax=Portunus trituberculatus TaxID=210409 RepID=A0A5B7DFW9_PORTR|nr:Disintegrin and metalloproteinase domain-containing protein 28 [Portunus trituberculatus]